MAVFVIVAYLVVVSAVGVALARRTTSASQWAIGGGGMGVAMIAVGVAGTRIGGAGTYGVAGDVLNEGVWNLWWYSISTVLAMALVGFMFAVPYRRLRLQTVGEVFTIRFGNRRNQVLTSLCVQTEYFIVNVIEAYVIGVILVGLTGMSMALGVTIAAALLIVYITFGGLWGAAVTNLIHVVVMLVGLSAVVILGVVQIGGWDAVTGQINEHLAAAGRDQAQYWSFNGLSWGAVLGMIFSVVIHTPAASIYTNFSTAAKSEKILVPGFVLAGFIGAAMPLLAGLIGVLTLARYGTGAGLSSYRNITVLATDISPLMGGLAIAAVLAAVISSGGPILLSSATMFVRDWLPATDGYEPIRKLKLYRITTVVYGVIAAFLAWLVYGRMSVLDLLLFGFAMVVPPAIAVGYLLYWRRTSNAGALWGMVSGYGGGLAWFGLIKLLSGMPLEVDGGSSALVRLAHRLFVENGGVDPSYATTIIPLVVVPIVSLLGTDDGESDLKRRFYRMLSGEETMAEAEGRA